MPGHGGTWPPPRPWPTPRARPDGHGQSRAGRGTAPEAAWQPCPASNGKGPQQLGTVIGQSTARTRRARQDALGRAAGDSLPALAVGPCCAAVSLHAPPTKYPVTQGCCSEFQFFARVTRTGGQMSCAISLQRVRFVAGITLGCNSCHPVCLQRNARRDRWVALLLPLAT